MRPATGRCLATRERTSATCLRAERQRSHGGGAAPQPPDWRREGGERAAEGDNRPNMHVSRGTEIEFQERRTYVTPAMTMAERRSRYV